MERERNARVRSQFFAPSDADSSVLPPGQAADHWVSAPRLRSVLQLNGSGQRVVTVGTEAAVAIIIGGAAQRNSGAGIQLRDSGATGMILVLLAVDGVAVAPPSTKALHS